MRPKCWAASPAREQYIDMRTILEEHWHHLPGSELFDFLETLADRGLDIFAVNERQEQFGANQISQK